MNKILFPVSQVANQLPSGSKLPLRVSQGLSWGNGGGAAGKAVQGIDESSQEVFWELDPR